MIPMTHSWNWMKLVYLPTWMVDFYWYMYRWIYHTWMVWDCFSKKHWYLEYPGILNKFYEYISLVVPPKVAKNLELEYISKSKNTTCCGTLARCLHRPTPLMQLFQNRLDILGATVWCGPSPKTKTEDEWLQMVKHVDDVFEINIVIITINITNIKEQFR